MKSKCGVHSCSIKESEVLHRFDTPLPKLDLAKAEKFRGDDSYSSAMPDLWESVRDEFLILWFSLGRTEGRRHRVSGGPFICRCEL